MAPAAPSGLEQELATTLLASAAIGDFVVSSRAYPPHCALPPHRHAEPYVTFVTDGAFVQVDDAARRRHRRGTAMLHAAGAHHADAFGIRGGRDLTVRLPRQWGAVDAAFAAAELPPDDFARITSALARELRAPDDVSPLIVEASLLETIALLRRRRVDTDAAPPWLARVRTIIAERYAEAIRLATIADEIGLHPVHLARSFRRHCGLSIGEAVRARRLRIACELLAATNVPVAEVALRCGFADQSHLSRAFARVMRTTPSEYRRMRRR